MQTEFYEIKIKIFKLNYDKYLIKWKINLLILIKEIGRFKRSKNISDLCWENIIHKFHKNIWIYYLTKLEIILISMSIIYKKIQIKRSTYKWSNTKIAKASKNFDKIWIYWQYFAPN